MLKLSDFTFTVNLAQCDYNIYNRTFRYILPQTIYLDPNCGYEARLVGIGLSEEFVNTSNCDVIFTRENPPAPPLKKTLPLSSAYKPTKFLSKINKIFESNDVKNYFGIAPTGSAPLQFLTDGDGTTTLKQKGDFDVDNFRIEFSRDLAIKLGFDTTIIEQLPYPAPRLLKINYNQEYLIVLADLVENSLINNEYLPIIHCCPFDLDTKTAGANDFPYVTSVRMKHYESSTFHPIKNYSMSAVNFRLLHETMSDVIFDTMKIPNILITIQLRRRIVIVR